MLCVHILTSIGLKIPLTSVGADLGPGWTTSPAAPVAPGVFKATQGDQPWSHMSCTRAGYQNTLSKAQPKLCVKGNVLLEMPK